MYNTAAHDITPKNLKQEQNFGIGNSVRTDHPPGDVCQFQRARIVFVNQV